MRRRQELHPRTAVINKTQKNKARKARHDALSWLAATFPQAFDNSIRIRPLKKGIMADILEYATQAEDAGISKAKLREAVVIFTRRLDYLACLKAREIRVDLQGDPVNAVTDEEAERAAVKIKRRIEKSLRNARQEQPAKQAPSQGEDRFNRMAGQKQECSSTMEYNTGFPDRPPAFSSMQSAATQINNRTPTVIKHRTSKSYDPEAIARLKEKLGLSRRDEKQKETT
ncbi:ProQ/FinO family protein [Legionella spiritensis]|uniref:ProQ n=1 Tax=Legionella spiritensis TaxID=452 RepID=A0A0W0Z015_LEGSP|nr:ProQ/FinO family protein [Legionella spiritensis]KTD62223.1 ProQ [Legionella spiritensis]SNV29120.1 ProQ [Legionella spiritensis]